MNELLAALSLKKFAAVVGALIAFKFFREMGYTERVVMTLASAGLGYIGGEAVAEAFKLGPKTEVLAIAVFAALGLTLLSALYSAMPEWITAARRKFLGS